MGDMASEMAYDESQHPKNCGSTCYLCYKEKRDKAKKQIKYSKHCPKCNKWTQRFERNGKFFEHCSSYKCDWGEVVGIYY